MDVRGVVRMILTKSKLSLSSIPKTRQQQLSFPVSAFSKDRPYVPLFFSRPCDCSEGLLFS